MSASFEVSIFGKNSPYYTMTDAGKKEMNCKQRRYLEMQILGIFAKMHFLLKRN